MKLLLYATEHNCSGKQNYKEHITEIKKTRRHLETTSKYRCFHLFAICLLNYVIDILLSFDILTLCLFPGQQSGLHLALHFFTPWHDYAKCLQPAQLSFPDNDFNTKWTMSSNSNNRVNHVYLVIDIFPEVHGKKLKWHHKRPSHVIKIRVTEIRIGASIWQTRVVYWTRPEKNRICSWDVAIS